MESELKVQLYVEILEKIYIFKRKGFTRRPELEGFQKQIMSKIDEEKMTNESIEAHLKKIRTLLTGDQNRKSLELWLKSPASCIKKLEVPSW